jgi:hypothetical protein
VRYKRQVSFQGQIVKKGLQCKNFRGRKNKEGWCADERLLLNNHWKLDLDWIKQNKVRFQKRYLVKVARNIYVRT